MVITLIVEAFVTKIQAGICPKHPGRFNCGCPGIGLNISPYIYRPRK